MRGQVQSRGTSALFILNTYVENWNELKLPKLFSVNFMSIRRL